MTVSAIFAALKQKNIKLQLDEQANLRVIGQKTALDQHLLGLIKENKAAIVQWLLDQQSQQRPELVRLARDKTFLPLSFSQKRLWFIDKMNGGSAEYNMPMALSIEGPFDIDAANQSIALIIERHAPLRTIFIEQPQGPVQQVLASFDFNIQRIDLSNMDEHSQGSRVRSLQAKDSQTSFDLSHDLMIRASYIDLVKAQQNRQAKGMLLFNMHHIASDGWSMGILIQSFVEYYQAFSQGLSPQLAPLAIEYIDYIGWQKKVLSGNLLVRGLNYWRQQLAGIPKVHGLMLDQPRAMTQSYFGANYRQVIESLTSDKVSHFCRQQEVTEFILLQSVFALLLSRFSQQSDIVVGTPVAGRDAQVLEPLIGFFINNLVLRTDCSGNPSFEQFLRNNKQTILAAFNHQEIPFDLLVEELNPPRDMSHDPIFQLVFTVNSNESVPLTLPQLSISPVGAEQMMAKVELEVNANVTPEGLVLDWTYNTALFSEQTIAGLASSYGCLVASVLSDPQQNIQSLPLIEARDKQRLIQFGQGVQPWPQSQISLAAQFAHWVEQTPHACAAVCGEHRLDYRQLDEFCHRLAAYLNQMDIGEGSRVGICLPRSLTLLVAVMGIVQSGAAYVALEPGLPQSRLQLMAQDADVELILISSTLLDSLQFPGVDILLMDEPLTENWLEEFADEFVAPAIELASEAYVLYTSGSSGRPKGVQISHGGLSHYLAHAQHAYLSDDITGAVVSSPLCFDATLTVLLTPLCKGKSVHLLSDGDKALAELPRYLFDEQHHWLFKLTPAHLDALVFSGSSSNGAKARHQIVIGGEQLRVTTLEKWKQQLLPQSCFINEYGPTETVVGTCTYTIDTHTDFEALSGKINVPIGQPIAGSELFVVGASEQLQPINSVGELYIAGAGLALGYVNLEVQSAAVFTEFEGRPVYKTGDLVHWLPSGELVFIGRRDEQVKIRGFRIELGEISKQLLALDSVQEACVCPIKETGQETKLAAYVVSAQLSQETVSDVCESYLRANLPEYMIPSYFTCLEHMPLTVNGKVDTRALPSPLRKEQANNIYVAPVTPLQKTLCASWMQALSLDKIGIKDNFFSIGGDSILSIRIVSLLRRENIFIEIKDIFAHQTVEKLALFIAEQDENVASDIEIAPYALLTEQEKQRVLAQFGELIEDAYPLSTLQSGMVFHTQRSDFNGMYHDVNAEHLLCRWDQSCFEAAFAVCINTHPILRSGIDLSSDRPLQLVYKSVKLPLTVNDITHLDVASQDELLAQWYEQRKYHVFDWLNGPLFAIHIFLRSDSSFEFVISFHHCVMDGWSRASFSTQLYGHYQKLLAGETLAAVAPNWIYREYIAMELASIEQAEAKTHFARILEDAPSVQLPQQTTAQHEQQLSQGEYLVAGFEQRSKAIIDLAKSLGVPPQVVLLAAHFKAMSVVSGLTTVLSCVVSNGRPEREGGDTGLGLFLNSVPMALTLPQGSWLNLIHLIFENYNDNIQHRYYPLAQIQQDNGMDLSEVLFNYTHFHVFDEIAQSEAEPADTVQVLASSGYEQTNFDFQVDVVRSSGVDQLLLRFKYNASLYSQSLIAQLGGYYLKGIDNILNDIHGNHFQQCLLSAAQLQYLKTLNPEELPSTSSNISSETVLDMFNHWVKTTPNAIAVSYQGQHLSYLQLASRANQLAHCLLAQGIEADILVGLSMTRGIELMVGMLAIIKAGGAYVPLDPSYPQERLGYMIENSGLTLILCENASTTFATQSDIKTLDISGLPLAQYPTTEPLITISPQQLIYVIYTSGSTGQPKGVMVEHGNVRRLLTATKHQFNFSSSDVWSMFHSYAFDFSVWEIWGALSYGARLVIVPQMVARSTLDFYQLVCDEGVTVLNQTPTAFSQFAQADAMQRSVLSLRKVIFGGEALNLADLADWVERRGDTAPDLINMYGITETTVHVTYRQLRKSDIEQARGSLIGAPIADLSIYILDQQQQQVPVLTCGEMYVGGLGVTRGYLNQRALTESRFITHPCAAGQRLYRTGDLARYLADGQIEYLGRTDAQVKIRGFRIELGEIEQQLLKLEAVSSCVVIAREDKPGEKNLVGYVVLSVGADGKTRLEADKAAQWLRQQLKLILPEHMIPAALVVMSQLPLTVNAKVDIKALPVPQDSFSLSSFVAPQGDVAEALAGIFADLLNRDVSKISAHDNFFDLGGHSLLVMALLHRIENKFSVILNINDVFEAQTLTDLVFRILNFDPTTTDFNLGLTLLKKGAADKTPLVFIHAVGGQILGYRNLVGQMTSEGAIYAVSAQNRDVQSISEMAKAYVNLIRTVAPQGKVSLAGWSMGGLVALEMARFYRAASGEVENLILIDTHTPEFLLSKGVLQSHTVVSQVALLASELNIDVTEISTAAIAEMDNQSSEDLLKQLLTLAKKQGRLPQSFELTHLISQFELLRHNQRLFELHQCQNYEGSVQLIKASRGQFATSDLGWGRLLQGEMTVTEVVGDHFSIMHPPEMVGLAQDIDIILKN